LGGVEIPHDRTSSATAMPMCCCTRSPTRFSGPAALGDMATCSPDTDQANRGRDSADMLVRAVAKVREAGYEM
jgi:2C-methyl-D-erythritol 2,4-cyclodiphosphate synthase